MKRKLTHILGRLFGRDPFRAESRDRAREPASLEQPTDAIYVSGPVIFHVRMEDCLYPHGMGFGPNGWHPFVETLKAFRRDRTLTYEGSPLQRFYESFQPSTMLELLFPEVVARTHAEAPLTRYGTREYQPFLPWDGAITEAAGERGLSPSHGHQGFGPVSYEKGKFEFERLVRVLQSIETHGYLPHAGGDGEIRGYFIADGERARFIVRVGQHRTAALAALGHERMRVGFVPDYPRVIDVRTVDRWPLVRDGPYDVQLAHDLVRAYLYTDGVWVAEQAGLLDTNRAAAEVDSPVHSR